MLAVTVVRSLPTQVCGSPAATGAAGGFPVAVFASALLVMMVAAATGVSGSVLTMTLVVEADAVAGAGIAAE